MSPGRNLLIRPKTNSKTKLPTIIPVTKSLMRLMGYWTAEGVYHKGIALYQLDEKVRHDMERVIEEVFPIRAYRNPGDKIRVDAHFTAIAAVFKSLFGAGTGSAKKNIPNFVMEQDDELLAEFLRGYFTGDGWAGSYIEAATKSRALSQQLLLRAWSLRDNRIPEVRRL